MIGAIDQGTSSTRFMVFDENGDIVGYDQLEHIQYTPYNGYVEHNPKDIFNNTINVIINTINKYDINASDIEAIGITNQRETSIIWNSDTGEPYYNAIVWNDGRTSDICNELIDKFNNNKNYFSSITGLPISPYFSATKILWMINNIDGLKDDIINGKARFGTIDSWLIWKLTNGEIHATDVTNASRTNLMNLQTLNWDKNIIKELNIPILDDNNNFIPFLPEIKPSSYIFGEIKVDSLSSILNNVKISGVLGDQQAALFGQTCFESGQSKSTYGTGCFLLMNTGENIINSNSGLLTTVAYQIGNEKPIYALEGSVAYSGALIQWLRDQLGIINSASETEDMVKLINGENNDLYIVPAFQGLLAPYWKNDARGVMVGLSSYHNKNHIVLSSLQATAFQCMDVLNAMNLDSGVPLKSLRVDGGMTVNEYLMQFQSDLLQVPVIKPKITETTALGVAYAAGLAVNFWNNLDELKEKWESVQEWNSNMDNKIRKKLIKGWKKAVERTFNWVDNDDNDENDNDEKIEEKNNEEQFQVIFVLGGPGAGKGTQCNKLVKNYGFAHLSAGDLLRAERDSTSGSEVSKLIKEYIAEGKIVPAEVTVGLLKTAMEKEKNENGIIKFLIDGFPRNPENLHAWEDDMNNCSTVTDLLFLDCAEEVMEERLLERGKTSGRSDDNAEAIKKRFRTYQESTIPIIEYFQTLNKVRRIDAAKTQEEVFDEIKQLLHLNN